MYDQILREIRQQPVACDVSALNAERRERKASLQAQLTGDVQEMRELPDGYAFRYVAAAPVLAAIMEFVTLERLCCPFLDFAIEVERSDGPVWFRMTGSEGAKEILLAELDING